MRGERHVGRYIQMPPESPSALTCLAGEHVVESEYQERRLGGTERQQIRLLLSLCSQRHSLLSPLDNVLFYLHMWEQEDYIKLFTHF